MINSQLSRSIACAVLAIGLFLPSFPTLASAELRGEQVKPQVINVTGTIRKLAVEGTCYQLAADGGKNYELMGKFPKIDGTRVKVRGVIATDMMTICQVGQPLQIKSIQKIR
jgi:hypothetical protein